MSKIEYTWQDTPQLWLASRLNGCPCPEHFKYGMGRTKEDALANLLEPDSEYCPKCDSGDTSFVHIEDVGLTYQKCGKCGEEWGHA
jgi:hypothetical protein